MATDTTNELYWSWQLLVYGNSNELRQLTYGHQSHYFCFGGGVNDWLDCPNDDFRINSIYLNDSDDAFTVSQTGHELISLFNGASCIFNPNSMRLGLSGIANRDQSATLSERSNAIGLLKRPDISEERHRQFLRDARKHDIRVFLLMLATENEDAYQILKYFDMRLDWVTYYKLLETVETHSEAKNIDLNIDKSERSAFRNTANNYSLSGLDSRHGFKESVKINKTASMTLDQAHRFISSAARSYLSARYSKSGT